MTSPCTGWFCRPSLHPRDSWRPRNTWGKGRTRTGGRGGPVEDVALTSAGQGRGGDRLQGSVLEPEHPRCLFMGRRLPFLGQPGEDWRPLTHQQRLALVVVFCPSGASPHTCWAICSGRRRRQSHTVEYNWQANKTKLHPPVNQALSRLQADPVR